MNVKDKGSLMSLACHLPYMKEEKDHAKHLLHAIEYNVWREWREAWSRIKNPCEDTSIQAAIREVSDRQKLTIAAVEEIVYYTERTVGKASKIHRSREIQSTKGPRVEAGGKGLSF